MTRRLAIAATGLAALALPAAASANVSAGAVTCTSATFHATNWGIGAERSWSLEVDGAVSASGTWRFSAPAHDFVFPLALTGEHVVSFRVGAFVAGPVSVSCGTPVTPPPPPVPEPLPVPPPVTPVGPPTVVPEPLTPIKPLPRKAKKAKPKPKLTCIALKRMGAGRSWYVRLGVPYWSCHVPRQRSLPPSRIPVTG